MFEIIDSVYTHTTHLHHSAAAQHPSLVIDIRHSGGEIQIFRTDGRHAELQRAGPALYKFLYDDLKHFTTYKRSGSHANGVVKLG